MRFWNKIRIISFCLFIVDRMRWENKSWADDSTIHTNEFDEDDSACKLIVFQMWISCSWLLLSTFYSCY